MFRFKIFDNFGKAFFSLFFTELWERFSYYGMKAILLLYMTYTIVNGGLGLPETLSISVVSLYGSFIYLSTVLGGFIGDRLLNPYKSVLYAGITIMFGHITLSLLPDVYGLFTGLILIMIGSGLLKPNITNIVGLIYEEKDYLRDQAFSLFYLAINVGAFIAPFIVGYFGEFYNFHLGFLLAAIGMFIGLLVYVMTGKKHFPKKSFQLADKIKKNEVKSLLIKSIFGVIILFALILVMFLLNIASPSNIIILISSIIVIIPIYLFYNMLSSTEINQTEKDRLIAYIPLFFAGICLWTIQEQNTVFFFAIDHIELGWFPKSWINVLNPLFIIALMPFFVYLWNKLGKTQPSYPVKFIYGLLFSGISFLILIFPAFLGSFSIKSSVLWIILSFFLGVVAELLISPIGDSLTNKIAPIPFKARLMGIWLLTDSIAQSINAITTQFFIGNETIFFTINGLIPIILAVIVLLNLKKIKEKLA
jgi:POT family proton-dependent oligopeptide transporter